MGFGDVTQYQKGFGAVIYGIKQKKEEAPTFPTLTAEGTNVNMERRLEAAGVPAPEAQPKQNFLTKALDILDRPGAAVRSGVAALYQGKSAGEALQAAKQGFTGQVKTTGQDVIEAGAARGAPIFQKAKEIGEKSKFGRVLSELAVDVALDPTTYLTMGTTKAATTGAKELAANITKEVLTETGTKIAKESAERLATNALKGEIPVGKLGTAINRALGYTAETKTIPTGFGKVAAAGKKAAIQSQAKGFRAASEDLLNQAQEMRKGILPKAGMLPPGPPQPDFVAGIKQVTPPRTFKMQSPADRLNTVIEAIKPEVERQVQQSQNIRQLVQQYGAVPIEAKKPLIEFLNKATGIPTGQLHQMAPADLIEFANSLAQGAESKGMYSVASRVAKQMGYNLESELTKANLTSGDLVRQLGEQSHWKTILGEKPLPKGLKQPSKIEVPYVEAISKETSLKVTNKLAKERGRQMAQPLEQQAKGFAKTAKDLEKQAKTVKAAKTTAAVTQIAGEPGFAKTTMRFMGQPFLDLTPALKPIQTVAGALIERSPTLTKITDSLGRVFNISYVPVSIQGTERAIIKGTKEKIMQTVREIPYLRSKGMREAGQAFKGISEKGAKEAPFVIEQTAKGTAESRRAATIASDLFAKDADAFAKEGIPLNTIDNYVQHLYTDPPEKVQQVIGTWRRTSVPGATPSFTKTRSIPNLEEAQRLGLHPVTDVRQLTMVHRAMTEQAVALQQMGRELIGMGKGVVQNADPGGWRNVTSTAIPSLKGKWVHPEVARALDNLYPVIANTDEGVKAVANIVDGAVRAWKALVLFRPGFHMRNFVGNVFLNMADGVFNPNRYAQSVAILSGALKEVELNGRKVPVQVIRDWFAQHALQGQGMFQEAASGAARSLTKEAAETLAKLQRNGIQNVAHWTGQWITHPFESSRKFGEATDSLGRMANFLHHLDTGLSPSEAASMTRKALFDYGALTPAEQQIRRYVAPFYSWTRFALPRMVERMVGAPGLFTGTAHLRESMVNAQGIDEANLPQYLRDNQAIPLWVDDKGNIHYLTWNLPLTELSRIHDPRDIMESWKEIAGMLNPLATLPGQLGSNTSLLTGQPITKYPELGGAPMWKDYGNFALNQIGMPREIANIQNQKEQRRLYEQAAEEGKPKEIPPTTKSPIETLSTMTSVQNPANWSRSKIYQQQELLKETIGAAKEQGIKIPDADTLPPMGEAKGFGSVSRGYGFGAVFDQSIKNVSVPTVVRAAIDMSGVDPSWGPYLSILMKAESEGNSLLVNQVPVGNEHATGLFQTLPSTFKEYAVKGHTDIFNPLDNTLAAINYIKARYGHPANIPRLGKSGYKGY